jgi:hypothetical protein
MEFIDFFSKTQQNIVYPQSTTFPWATQNEQKGWLLQTCLKTEIYFS